jgi:superfamily I DNA/RNA helicase
MSHQPTPEQAAIVDAAAAGNNLVVEAGAGTGKTSTLKLLAAAKPRERGVYLAYNKAIAGDAARSFPPSVLCKTAHSMAYGAVGRLYAHRLKAHRQPARVTAQILGIREPARVADDLAPLAPQQLARLAMATVDRFCHSADVEPGPRHVPVVAGLDDRQVRRALAAVVVPIARKAWDDIQSRDGQLRFTHDAYLKLWGLSHPRLDCDYVLLDEAQDANPVIAAIVDDQTASQRILVGDRSQAIYGWRGAIDAMARFAGQRLALSQSFRFGQAVADEANKWLTLLDAPLRLSGHRPIASRLAALAAPDAVLCRTNAHAVTQVMAATGAGRKAALVGGGAEIRRLVEAAIELKAGRGTSHPELFAFTTWAEVQDYVDHDHAGADLKVFVGLIDTYGPDRVIEITDSLVDEDDADVIISTAHKAKGREWGTIRIAADFREPKRDEDDPAAVLEVPREDAMLAYVAVTRAKLVLDREGLAWVDRWVGAQPAPAPAADPEPTPAVAVTTVEPAPTAVPQQRAGHCLRCGSEQCICSATERRNWLGLTGAMR